MPIRNGKTATENGQVQGEQGGWANKRQEKTTQTLKNSIVIPNSFYTKSKKGIKVRSLPGWLTYGIS